MNDNLADDILEGADKIAEFMGWNRRRVFYAADQKLIPTFKIGNHVCAKKSTLRKHFEDLEKAVE